jgi:hypothetical protein
MFFQTRSVGQQFSADLQVFPAKSYGPGNLILRVGQGAEMSIFLSADELRELAEWLSHTVAYLDVNQQVADDSGKLTTVSKLRTAAVVAE